MRHQSRRRAAHAHARERAIAKRSGQEVEAVPVLFAALLDAHGTKGPAEIPAKRVYTYRDAYRKAHRLGLPTLRPPPSHPFNPLLALRVASLPLARVDQRRLIDALFAATWTLGTGIEAPDAVAAAARAAGLDGDALVAACLQGENPVPGDLALDDRPASAVRRALRDPT